MFGRKARNARLWCAALILAPCLGAAQDEDLIAPADWLFIYGRVDGCGMSTRLVDMQQVGEDGRTVVLRDIAMMAEGHSEASLSERMADIIETRSGNRPKTVRIRSVSPDAPEFPGMLQSAMVDLVNRYRGCPPLPKDKDGIPDNQGDFRHIATCRPGTASGVASLSANHAIIGGGIRQSG